MSGVKLTLGFVALVEHQWLCALHPGVSVLIRKAPDAKVGDSCVGRLAEDGAVDISLDRVVERVIIQLSDCHLQSERLVGVAISVITPGFGATSMMCVCRAISSVGTPFSTNLETRL